MALNTQFPEWLARQIPDQQSNARLDAQVSANLMHGAERKQKNRQLAIQESQEARSKALFPLQEQSMRNQLQMQSYEILDAQFKEQAAVEARKAASELNQFVSSALKGGTAANDETMAGALDILSRYPAAAMYPHVQDSLKQLSAAKQLREQYNMLAQKQQFESDQLALQEQARTDRALLKPLNPLAAQREVEDYRQSEIRLQEAISQGAPQEIIDSLKRDLDLKRAKYFPGKKIRAYDAQGNPVFEMDEGGLDVYPGTATEAQKQIGSIRQSTTQLISLATNLRDEDVGVSGVVGEFLGDRFIPQFDPSQGTYDPVRVKNRTQLKSAIENLLGQLTKDPRLSNKDREALMRIAPSSGAWESGPRARESALMLTEILKGRAQDAALNAKQPIQDWMLTDKQITEKVRAGELTPERGAQLRREHYPMLYR